MKKLFDKGVEGFSLYRVIGQNIFFIVYFTIGAIGLWPIQMYGTPLISIAYILFLIVMILFVLRKHLCTKCYYYGKLCSTGWGKLSAWIFEKNSGNYRFGVKLATVTWTLAMLIPITGMVLIMVVDFSYSVMIILAVFIVLTFLNFFTHRDACKKCKMKFICPASISK